MPPCLGHWGHTGYRRPSEGSRRGSRLPVSDRFLGCRFPRAAEVQPWKGLGLRCWGQPGCYGLVAIVVPCLSFPSLGAGLGMPAPLAAPQRAGRLQRSRGSPAGAMPGGGEGPGEVMLLGRVLSFPPAPGSGQPRTPGSLLPSLCLTQPRRFPGPRICLLTISGLVVLPGQGRSPEGWQLRGALMGCGARGWNRRSGDGSSILWGGSAQLASPSLLLQFQARVLPEGRGKKDAACQPWFGVKIALDGIRWAPAASRDLAVPFLSASG